MVHDFPVTCSSTAQCCHSWLETVLQAMVMQSATQLLCKHADIYQKCFRSNVWVQHILWLIGIAGLSFILHNTVNHLTRLFPLIVFIIQDNWRPSISFRMSSLGCTYFPKHILFSKYPQRQISGDINCCFGYTYKACDTECRLSDSVVVFPGLYHWLMIIYIAHNGKPLEQIISFNCIYHTG